VISKKLKMEEKKVSTSDLNDNLQLQNEILFEQQQEQTKLIKRISNNVLFYFWLTIISFVLSITVFILWGFTEVL
jgi:hypothetical protein